MLDEICAEIRNYFTVGVYRGDFRIQGGMISPTDFLQDGQYFRITGSVFNDGVYRYPAESLTDETFCGEVWAMAPPPALLSLSEEIKKYAESDAAKPSPFVRESIDGYSYTRAAAVNSRNIYDNSWQTVFGRKLNRWRKI